MDFERARKVLSQLLEEREHVRLRNLENGAHRPQHPAFWQQVQKSSVHDVRLVNALRERHAGRDGERVGVLRPRFIVDELDVLDLF
ncbi:hypothetical protein [Bradyrhizobium sp. Rc2d]|uniref:hypothetical protein n=1 Tax=Bradyrhizobium sp. Rc2d TaxID=1855321 RepID=UPI001FCE0809|nr:hypothetical protein [Bradyrhizobium sp. Rc2d]